MSEWVQLSARLWEIYVGDDFPVYLVKNEEVWGIDYDTNLDMDTEDSVAEYPLANYTLEEIQAVAIALWRMK